jgi:peptidoglycan/LPS O-acetylase OafA/YrhL
MLEEIKNNKEKLSFVDEMRGLAILMVIFVHAAQPIKGLSAAMLSVSEYGQMGVQLFFVASAYTLCLASVRRKGEALPLLSFFVRRFFRIAPLYYMAIAFYYLIYVLKSHFLTKMNIAADPYTLLNVLSNVFFIHGFVPAANNIIVPGGWSIGTEMAFYMVFPLLFILFDRLHARGIGSLYMLVALTVLINIIAQWLLGSLFDKPINNNTFYYYHLLNQLPVFLTGMVVFYSHQSAGFGQSRATIWKLGAGFFICSALTVLLWKSGIGFAFAVIPFTSGLAFSFLLNLLRAMPTSIGWLCKTGRVSYSMYIFHFVFAFQFVRVFMKIMPTFVPANLVLIINFVLISVLSYIVAVITERHIEAWGIRLGSTFISYLRRITASTAPVELTLIMHAVGGSSSASVYQKEIS